MVRELDRRCFSALFCSALAAAACKNAFSWSEHSTNPPGVSGHQAINLLKEGNLRFVQGRAGHPRQDKARRAETTASQHPFAAVLGCADSRVPPEVIFDQGLGDLFSVRVAGNVVDQDVLASLEYSVKHLGTRAIIVLGHEACGAVKAALSSKEDQAKEPQAVRSLLDLIKPAIAQAGHSATGDEGVRRVVEANISNSIHELQKNADWKVLSGREGVVFAGGFYSLADGKVSWIS